ncbi:monovalent cation:proton antiporter family protein [Metabacillus sp. GX 13764]|uniref:monovalent cation:proton antiporter family protein n=1 Tax=Metabacillus kandeliae TaxID=2900151 RepID=UPI001E410D5A|nr:monovalent cation:proton antiporter family protein [Metabacillus kandeliae]MCD7034993.1 monovalent cation:proton antiporter family protein [Metabacillus kandeliae]
MEHQASVASLVIVILVAFLTPILMHRFRLNFMPVIVAEILMGLVIGESGFNIVHEDTWLTTLSTLGFIFLMFLSGLEIDFSVFSSGKKKEILPSGKEAPNTFTASFLIFAGIFVLSLVLSYGFVLAGFVKNVFLMTLIISTISLGVVVPTLKEVNLMKSNIGQIILLVAVIADLATMILLAVFASVFGDGNSNTWLLLVLFAAGVGLYFVGRVFQKRSFIQSMSKGTVQIGTRAVFTLIIVLVAVSETIGAENILGAFLAGVLVSLLSPNKELVQKLDSFGYGFLIPIFFVMIGVKLDIWGLFKEPKILALIPLLLAALFLSKLLPVYLLKRWYDQKTAVASGFLLTSTLSLVIAAATIGEKAGVIDAKISGAFVLVAVLSSIIAPIGFKKLFPLHKVNTVKQRVAFVGANQMSLPVTRELESSLYEAAVYHTRQDKMEKQIAESLFTIHDLDDYDPATLKKNGVFEADILVASTGEEEQNAEIALLAKKEGVKRVIAVISSPELEEKAKEAGVEIFSVFTSTKTLLRVMIESPHVMEVLTNDESALYEVEMKTPKYHKMMLRHFPFTGDLIFIRIFRGKDSLIPHGDTELLAGDRLLVSGTKQYVNELRKELER